MKRTNIHIAYSILLAVTALICFSSPAIAQTDGAVSSLSPDYLPADSIFARYLRSTGVELSKNNKITLIGSGAEKFQLLFADLQQTQQEAHLEYFNFRNDSIATLLFQQLTSCVQRGVKVRAMFDGFGNLSNNQPLQKKHVRHWNKQGIELVQYDPIVFPYLNHVFSRDHQKIVVLDNKIAYTGGMNVADYYINGLPGIGEWRDMHLRIEGAVALDLQRAFLYTWNKTTRQHLTLDSLSPTPVPDETDTLGGRVAIVQRIPRKSPKAMRQAYVRAIDAAEHSVQIINPYFTPTSSIRKALKRAVKRGVKVEVMIPGKSDIPFTPDAAFYIANQLRKKGVRVYVFNGGFHHSKIMMIDGRFCTVGSTNLNARSLRYDYEINAFLFDLPITAELQEIFEADKEESTVLTQDEYKKKKPLRRLFGWFAHLLTPFL